MYREAREPSPYGRVVSRRVEIVSDRSYRKRDRSRSPPDSRYNHRSKDYDRDYDRGYNRRASDSHYGRDYSDDFRRPHKRTRTSSHDDDSELTLVLQDPATLVNQRFGPLVERNRPVKHSDLHSLVLASCKPYHLFQFWNALTLRRSELENSKEFRIAICAGHSRDLTRLLHYNIFHRTEEQMIDCMDPAVYSWTEFIADIQALATVLGRRRGAPYNLEAELMRRCVERVDIHRIDPDGGYTRILAALLSKATSQELDRLERDQRSIIDHMVKNAFNRNDPDLQSLKLYMNDWWDQMSEEDKDKTSVSRYIYVLRRYLAKKRDDALAVRSSISFQLD